MTITQVIEFLEELRDARGNISVSCDFRTHDDELFYNEEVECIFGS